MNKKSLLIVGMLGLSACSSNVGSSWNCKTPTVDGAGCLSVASADARANQRHVEVSEIASSPAILKIVKRPEANVDVTMEQVVKNPMLHRTEETVARVWFSPFVDKYSNRHEESVVYFVDNTSSWRN